MKRILILILAIGLPILEIGVAVWLGHRIGWGPALILGAAFFGFGVAMVRRALQNWGRLAQRAQTDPGFLNSGFGPAMGDSGLLLVGGVLLMIPGFITGLAGLVLVIPPTRRLIGRAFGGRLATMAGQPGYRRVTIIDGETVASTTEPPPGPRSEPFRDPGPPNSRPGPPDEPVIIVGELVAGPGESGSSDRGTGSSTESGQGSTKRPDRPGADPDAS